MNDTKIINAFTTSQAGVDKFDAIAARPAPSDRTDFIREIVVNYRGPRRKSPEFERPWEVAYFVRTMLLDNSREQFIVLFLDGRNRVIGYSRTAVGVKNSCPVHIGEVYQKAVLVGAANIIVAHNHPSGDPAPSPEDRRMTADLRKAGELLGIPLLDHLIVTDEGHFSFNESGQL